MPLFNCFKVKELTNYLYYSHIHDSNLEEFMYDREHQILTIKTFNPINHIRIKMVFIEVRSFLSVSGNEFGSRVTINSLTVEDVHTFSQNNANISNDILGDSLYLLFQMFSNDELHIISNTVLIEEMNTGDGSGRQGTVLCLDSPPPDTFD